MSSPFHGGPLVSGARGRAASIQLVFDGVRRRWLTEPLPERGPPHTSRTRAQTAYAYRSRNVTIYRARTSRPGTSQPVRWKPR
jgi:hypothetical protein